jgi:hypothetical protein
LDYVFLILLGLAWAVGTPIVAIIALARTSGLRDQNARLAAEIAALRRQIDEKSPAAEFEEAPATEPSVEAAALPPPFV